MKNRVRIFVRQGRDKPTACKIKAMKLTVYRNTKTNNLSLFADTYSPVNTEVLTFSSAGDWFEWYHKYNCTSSGMPRNIRIKRRSGQQFGDKGGNYAYTLKIANNDFQHFAK